MTMNTRAAVRALGLGVAVGLAVLLWLHGRHGSRLGVPRDTAAFDVSALLSPAANRPNPNRARPPLNKAPDLMDRARLAQASSRSPAEAATVRDNLARRLSAGLRNHRTGPGTTPLTPVSGKTRGTGQRVLEPAQQQAVNALKNQLGAGASLQMDPAARTLRHVRGPLAAIVQADAVYAAARERGDFAGMALATASVLAPVLNVQKPAEEFIPRPPDRDDLGMVHVRLDQRARGLPVYGAQVILHFNAQGDPIELSGVYAPTPRAAGEPRFLVDEAAAITRAQQAVGRAGPGQLPPQARRVLYWNPNVSPVPAYVVTLVPAATESWEVVIAAEDGQVLHRLPTTYTAAAVGQANDLLGQSRPVHSWQQGNEFLAIDTTAAMYDAARSVPPAYTNLFGALCIFDVQDQDVEVALQQGIGYVRSTDRNRWDPTAVSVLSHFARIYEYYRTTHNRNSFDDRGISLTALIHARFKNSRGELYKDNAFFNPNLNLMVFGDGERSTTPGLLPAGLDIAAHELTHGVVDNSAAFRYENQSGALHEHSADYFACMVDREDWLLGEDTVGGSAYTGWRDLSNPRNPQVKEPGPKTMAEYENLPNTPEGDLGGVHVNSTIPSYATYLFTAGENGLGREKAEKIVYRALTRYLTQYAEFVDYRRALISAANDLHPNGPEAQVIAQAFDAVQILDGTATPPPTPVPATSGEERVAFLRAEYDDFFGDFLGYGLYVMTSQDYELVSFTALDRVRPAVSGDGTWALCVDSDHNVFWTDGETEDPLTDTEDVRTIALSKDQRWVAFTTTDFDNQIHLLNTDDDSVRSATIRVPTSGEQVTASFADVLAFNCLGDILYFDAFAEGVLGQAEYGCWGLFALRVKDLQCHTLLPLSPGLQVGNPALANTLPHHLVADYVYTTNGQSTLGVVSLDLSRNDLHVLLRGLDVFAAPTFRGDDRQLVFGTYSGGLFYLNEATLTADRTALAEGSSRPLLWSENELTYPVGFRSGTYVPPAGRLQLEPATLDFGSVAVGSATTRRLELSNAGNADLDLLEVTLEGPGVAAFDFGSALQKRLAVGQRQSLELAFTPGQTGTQTATLRFKSTAPNQPDVTASLTGTGAAGPAKDYWREVWQDFQDRYSYFDHKGINWPAVYETHRNAFTGLTPSQFGQKLNEVLQVLHDWHVSVRLPDGNYIGYAGEYPRNYLNQLSTHYTGGALYANVRNANVFYHARLTGNWAHLVVDTLATEAFATLTDADLEEVFAQHADAAGWILDLRANSGGNEANAAKFASRLTEQPVTYGHVRYRIPGTVPYQFEDFTAKVLQPSTSPRYLKPAVGLIGQRCMSSAEWFTLMLRACPNVVLVGDRTRGASGSPATRTLPDLNLEYALSTWIAYDEQRQPFEDRGLAPAIAVPPAQSIDDTAQRDYVLEQAIAYLQWRQSLGNQLPLVSARSDRDQDGQPDVHEFLAGTDAANPADRFGFLAGGIRQPAAGQIELRWKGVAGKRYHVGRAASVAGPFTRIAPGIEATPPTNAYVDRAAAGPGPYFYRLELDR